ncbi:MAG: GlsB/YeaQ/YmgE family stress response membrane protein [Nitrospirota bacterium]
MEQFQSILESLGAMGVIGTLVIGVLAGFAATILMPGNDPSGLIITPLLGIAGSSLGTYLGDLLDVSTAGEVSGFVAAVGGAMLILVAYRIVFRKTG